MIIEYIDIDFNRKEYLLVINLNDSLVRTGNHD